MRYIGDDLINLMTVHISAVDENENPIEPDIEAVELKIGCLDKKYVRPTNPFTVDVMRDESVKLSINNKVYAAVWYWDMVNGVRTLLKKTCEGTLTIQTKVEVVNGGCNC